MSTFPLLSTKLSLPPRRTTLVSRPRLLANLEVSLLPGNRLTLISAPAGYGKTTLVADWQTSLARRHIPLAWFSLDEADNDLLRFIRYLVAALETTQPALGDNILAMLDLPQPPQPENLMLALINEIKELPGDIVLVLDDYHLITEGSIHQALTYLIDHQPAQFHLVLTTRSDPPFPMARLRARGEVNEIRSSDLRFSEDEAASFIFNASHLDLTAGQAANLEQRTEGWIAGLQMAVIALQAWMARSGGTAQIDNFVESFNGTHQFIFDFLAQEVLKGQDAGIINFLNQTSILERLSPDLCNAITGRSDSARILKMLDQTNLFLQPLDEHRQWYRYHPLFADYLQAGLEKEQRSRLVRRASAWCEQSGLFEEAVSYSFKAEDWSTAVRLLNKSAPGLLISGKTITLVKWCQRLPESVLFSDPELCIFFGWAALWNNGVVEIGVLSDQASQHASRYSVPMHGRLLGLQAYLAYAVGNFDEAARLGRQSIEQMDPADGYFRMAVLSMVGQLLRQAGNMAEAIQLLEEAVHAGKSGVLADKSRTNTSLILLEGNLAIAYHLHGERRRAMAYCENIIRKHTHANGSIHPIVLFTYIPWAYALFDGNELATARQYFEICADTCQKMGTTPTVVGGAHLIAEINFIEGEIERAMNSIQATRQEAEQLGWPWIARNAAAVEAWLNLRRGHLAEVETWERETNVPILADPTRDVEQLVLARLFIARGQLTQGRDLLEQMRSQAVQAERVALLIEIQVLLAIVEEHDGRRNSALTWIEQATRLAAPEGTLRPFLNDDTRILVNDLRARLNLRGESTLVNFLDQIMGYLEKETQSPGLNKPVQPQARSAGLVEPVTPRELEVLRLMASGLTNAEIARQLYLTINTLKAHTNSIYGKLAVHSRIQAVNRARELGLLPGATPG